MTKTYFPDIVEVICVIVAIAEELQEEFLVQISLLKLAKYKLWAKRA
jgi:hypothetical protein